MAQEGSNKAIAKNTVSLYFRSILMMMVNLYASRVILQALGVDDFGLYGAIGSIVAMFTIINNTLAAGTSRFLTFELGRKDAVRLQKTFSASLAMHVAIAILLFVLMESVGLWFVNMKMNIPEGRGFAANIVYQLSILTCMFSLTQVPYNASIIAHERMDIYAYVGIAEATFKLALVMFLLYIPTADNLIAYAVILAVWSIGLQVFYRYFCYKRFPESHLTFCRDKSIYAGMLKYCLWDFIGQFCATGNGQGLNLLINVFFGVTVNAARTIAYQVDNAILTFVSNFLTSVQPQIVKSYAAGDNKRFFQLVHEASRFAFFLMSLFALPIVLESDFVLKIWLKDVPEYTSLFLRCIVTIALFRTFSRPVVQAVHATGNVKFLNLSSGLFNSLTYLPCIYVFYSFGWPVWTCFIIHAFSAVVSSLLETYSLYRETKFNALKFFVDVYFRSMLIVVISSILPLVVMQNMQEGWIRLISVCMASSISIVTLVAYIGISKEMRLSITHALISKIRR